MAIGAAAVLLIIVFRKTALALGLAIRGMDRHRARSRHGAGIARDGQRHQASAFVSRGTSLLQAIGRCSYEIYLTHMFVVFAIVRGDSARYSARRHLRRSIP